MKKIHKGLKWATIFKRIKEQHGREFKINDETGQIYECVICTWMYWGSDHYGKQAFINTVINI